MYIRIPVAAALLFARFAIAQEATPILERLPDDIQGRIRQQIDVLEGDYKPQAAGQLGTFWTPGSVVTVAFEAGPRGGSDELCREIAEVASQWTENGNVKWSFFDDQEAVRRWNAADTEYKADIRVSFDLKGHWSVVGVDSRDPFISPPSTASLNLQNFDKERGDMWKYYVLHEFGHALGFLHEHQRPDKPCDFLFSDEPGYVKTYRDGVPVPDAKGKRPGVYRTLGGYPNYWSESMVNSQLKALQVDERNLLRTAFDHSSIMKYYFPCSIYEKGCDSPCCGGGCTDDGAPQLPLALSDLDKEMVALAYPTDPAKIKVRTKEREDRQQALQKARELLNVSP